MRRFWRARTARRSPWRSSPTAVIIGLVAAPPEVFMGDVYRIIFVHVPSAWLALVGVPHQLRREPVLPVQAAPRRRRTGRVDRRARRAVLHAGPRHRLHLGPAHLGRVVDLGPAPDDRRHPVARLLGLPRAAQVRRRTREARHLGRGRRHRHRRRHPDRVVLGEVVEQPAPAAVGPELDGPGDAQGLDVQPRRVHCSCSSGSSSCATASPGGARPRS